MINYNFYKLFNPDLKRLSNNQLLIHFKKNSSIENRIYSIETFFNKYPYFDCDQYKFYNIDIIISDKYELMYHWHSIGLNENRICSDKYFNMIYPNFQINNSEINNLTNFYEIKNRYHKNKLNNNTINNNIINNNISNNIINNNISNNIIDNNISNTIVNNIIDNTINNNDVLSTDIIDFCESDNERHNNFVNTINTEINKNNLKLNYFLDPNKDIVSIYILNKLFVPFVLKSLSLLNYHEMNIILLSEKIIFFNDINIFDNFEKEDDKMILFNLSDYIISDNLEILLSSSFKINLITDDLKDVKKIFIPNNLVSNNLIINNIIFIDNTFNNYLKLQI
jgi:hypothetical protein